MEEIQKKTKKDIDIKEDKKVTKAKVKSTKKDVKEPKATVSKTKTSKNETAAKTTQKTKKNSSTKTTKAEKEEKLEKPVTKRKTKSSSETEKKATKSPKASSEKKETKTSKKTATNKEKTAKPKTKKENEIKEDKIDVEPKFTIVYEKKEEIEPEKSEEKVQKDKAKKEKKTEEKQAEKKIEKDQKAEDQKDKRSKPKKGYIEISVGAIICVAIIVGLVVLNVKLVKQAYNAISKNVSSNTSVEDEDKISVTQELGTALSSSDEIVSKMKEKITFLQNATASIYKEETFSSGTISNELKLRIGWAKVKEEKKLRSINEDDKPIEALEREVMEENIKNVFGPKIKYKDESFNNTDVETFSAYCLNKGTITYDNGLYTSVVVEDNEDVQNKIKPIIYQEIQKVVKYSDKIVVYVKVAYMDANEDKYTIYKRFNGSEFEYNLMEATQEEIFKDDFNPYTGEGTVTATPNESLDSIRNELDTYKYTFSLDEETGEYYLTKFNKALSMQ